MHHAYTADLAACTPQHDCGDVLSQFGQSYDGELNLTQLLVIAAPGLIGIFWGAPLIARELETGTDQVAWNQSVTRTRWLAVKLTGVGLAAIAAAAVLSYLLTWWAGPLDHINGSRFAAVTFASRDIVPLAYAAFAFALGTTAGTAAAPHHSRDGGDPRSVHRHPDPRAHPHPPQPAALHHGHLPHQPDHREPGHRHLHQRRRRRNLHRRLPIPQGAWVISAPPVEDSSGQVVAAIRAPQLPLPEHVGPSD